MLNSPNKGFTLLELIVVIVIIGILAGLIAPTYNTVKEGAEVRAAQSGAEAVGRNAVAIAALDGTYTVSGDDLDASLAETEGATRYTDSEDVDALGVTVDGHDFVLEFEGTRVTAVKQ